MQGISVENLYYLGPEGSNSHLAALKTVKACNIFAENLIPSQSIKHALEKLEKDPNSFCTLPCENSIEGIVRETVDNMLNFTKDGIHIQGEIILPIEHCLLSSQTDKTKIELIISHPQALAQCSNYLHKNFPNIPVQSVSSTSYAAKKAFRPENKNLAALANESCAQIYNLNILERSVNDEKDNKTRFFVIGRKSLQKSGNAKTALILSTTNRSGALCDVLKVFEKYSINLTCIDSRPSKKKLGEYLFFMELDELENGTVFNKALSELNRYTDFVKILGSFSTYN